MRNLKTALLTAVLIFVGLTALDAFHLVPGGLAHYAVLGGVAVVCSIVSQLISAAFARKTPVKPS